MSHWNYRVIRHKEKDGDIWYGIHIAHYDDNESLPHSWSEEPEKIIGDNLKELEECLDMYNVAIKKPALEIIDGEKLQEI